MRQPEYFKSIQENASRRWEQLELDPELAGPWHQLFRQVQSPRHVVSELLQNADDAGATEATVEIDNGEFIFSHNGEDFNEEQFASLCRFGFSNKRTLHTIGFRGVGFKSTFSLGDEVRLLTPTLAVAFPKERFTEPKWIAGAGTSAGRTEVRVAIQNERIQQELGKNLQEWGESPASLLFFNNIRSLRIHEQEIRWESQGPGPVEGSESMSVSTAPGKQYLVIRSAEEEFPDDALQEIRDERMAPEDDPTFPPCRMEIVLGLEGRLFVVLPTGVITQLPFTCNAPFIQDPARMKIKDPALSPTNGWLLRRAGELAADAMSAWVSQESLAMKERCQAYELLPDVDRKDNSIEGSCGTIVEEQFETRIKETKFLLTEARTLEPSGQCLSVPHELLDVWSAEQITEAFSRGRLPILSRFVRERDREKLINWQHIQCLDKSQILDTLRDDYLPRPRYWRQLLQLWSYVSPEVGRSWPSRRNVRIVPAQGKEVLYAAEEVVRLGERRALQPSDWEFLGPYLTVLDQDWIRFLADQRRASETGNVLDEQVQAAFSCISALGLADSTSAERLVNQVAKSFFSMKMDVTIQGCARLAHIAARLGAAVPDYFEFVTQDPLRRKVREGWPILADLAGDLDIFVASDWYGGHVLHDAYGDPSGTCTVAEWRQWVETAGSRVRTFVPLVPTKTGVTSRERLTELLRQRQFDGEPYFHYKRDSFLVADWDFEPVHWDYWYSLAQDDDQFWSVLLTRIMEQPQTYWSGATSARAVQVATTGNTRAVTQAPLVPSWIIRFRDLPCLPDTLGRPRQPAALLRRTPATEPLLGVEHFVKSELDTEATRPLLDLLGVRDKPTGPKQLLERLRSLAGSSTPLVPEVQRWCHSLDQLFDRCSTGETREIREAFAKGKLILTEQEGWASPEEVFLNPDEDGVPGAELVHPSLRELALWRKVGVTERPTADLAINWLKGLPSGRRLTVTQIRRVRSLLPNYPYRIWDECGHWLTLEGEWARVGSLAYSLTMQSLVRWNHLFPGVQAKTADFHLLPAETYHNYPFSTLQRLGDVIEERFQGQSGLPNAQAKPWLSALGEGLRRIVLDDADQTERVREVAHRLAQTKWQVAAGLESIPFISGTPAGTSRPLEVLWRDNLLYVQQGSTAKMARVVPQEVGRAFDRPEITEAIKLCYERPSDFINEYLEENFSLVPLEEVELIQPSDESAVEGKQSAANLLPSAGINGADTSNADIVEAVVSDAGINGESPTKEPADGELPTGVLQQPRPPQPSLMERFAQARGFSINGTGKFYHADGSCLGRTHGNAFPWERRTAAGAIVQYYWHKEHCIQQEPLQLGAEIWNLCERNPDLYSLILTDSHGDPIEISGNLLADMREEEELVLFPATYRLEYRGRDSR